MIGGLSRKNILLLAESKQKNKISVAKDRKSCYNSLRNETIPFKKGLLLNKLDLFRRKECCVLDVQCSFSAKEKDHRLVVFLFAVEVGI